MYYVIGEGEAGATDSRWLIAGVWKEMNVSVEFRFMMETDQVPYVVRL